MDKYYRMSREKFEQINQAQKDSGLSIIDFCSQNAYSVKSFYTWRYKFGFSERNTGNDPHPPKMSFAPVNISSSPVAEDQNPAMISDGKSEDSISMELPNGIRIHFNGKAQSGAFALITKMLSSDVLP